MAWSIEIDGVAISSCINFPSIKLTEGIAARGDKLQFKAKINYSDLAAGNISKPRSGNIVVLTINGTKMFEGTVVRTSDNIINPDVMVVSVDCGDYTFFLDRRLVAKQSYSEGIAGTRIKSILQEFAIEFSDYTGWDTNIADGLILPEEGYDYEPVSAILDRICSSTDYNWYVGFDASSVGRPNLHFFARETDASPLSGPYSNALDLDTNLEIGGVPITEDISELHNVVIIKDFTQKADYPYVDTQTADGEQTFFHLPLEPWDFGTEDMTVEVWHTDEGEAASWIERTTALDPLDGSSETIDGVTHYAYACILNWGIRFPMVDLGEAGDWGLRDGDLIKTTFDYVVPDRIAVFMDIDSVNEMSRRESITGEYVDGEHQVMISLPDYRIDSPSDSGFDPVEFYGRMILEEQAWPIVSGSFTLKEPSRINSMDGWHSGQYFTIRSEVRDIYDIREWVKRGRDDADKIPMTVWITSIERRIVSVIAGGVSLMETTVNFSNKIRR